jgi:hypothetical protein
MSSLLGAAYNWSFGVRPNSQHSVFAEVFRNIAVHVNVAIVGKLAQTVVPGGTVFVPFETQALHWLDSEEGPRRFISFLVQLVIPPLI